MDLSHISEPMEPPAPVTRIVLSLETLPMRSRSSWNDLASDRSLISTSRIWETRSLPEAMSVMDGTVPDPDLRSLADLDDAPAKLPARGREWAWRCRLLRSSSLQILGSSSTVARTVCREC